MKYTVTITANSTPNSQGWSDPVIVEHNGEMLFSGIGSTCPNPKQHSSGKGWRDAYGWIAEGVYDLETIDHHKYGRCCLINGGTVAEARYPNTNNGNKNVLLSVLIHEGNRRSTNKEWRGSAGCPTIHPLYWQKFSDSLPDGKGVLIIKGRN
jgi:hypothetical protein